MKSFKHSLALVSSVTCLLSTLAGCGHPVMLAPIAAASLSADYDAQGRTRTFGFDFDHYRNDQAPKARVSHLTRQGSLPPSADLRANCPPVYDQGQLGACTAFAIGKGLREILSIKNDGKDTPLSALFFYYQERVADGDPTKDAGSTTTTGMHVLETTGIAPDSDWPYVDIKTNFKKAPPASASSDAAQFKITSDQQIAFADIKTALANGQPVALGFEVYKSFMTIGKDGMMPMPVKGDKVDGGHEVCVVGYDDDKQVLIVRNSWGPSWGDGGYFYMPYAFASNTKLVDDIWTASK